jgi:hypothetical protein
MRKIVLFLILVFLAFPSSANSQRSRSYSSGSSRSSFSPSRSYSKPSSKPSNISPSKPKSYGSGDKPSSKSYGSGDKPSSKSYGSGDKSSSNSRPRANYDNKAGQAQQKAESAKRFKAGTEPAATYTDSKGKTQRIDPKDAKIKELRKDLSWERYQNREYRQRDFYNNVYFSRPVVIYHDPYSSIFWWWLLDRSIEQQALWAYHHRYSMDQARYNDLLAKNAELAGRVRALEQQGVVRNTAYQPAGMKESDLMYNDEYVKAVYNPQPEPHSFGYVLKVLLTIFLLLGIISLMVWLVFVKKW